MHPTLQLLERHVEEIQNTAVHWFDCPEPDSSLIPRNHNQFNINFSSQNSAQLDDTQWPTAAINILFYPKAKDRLHWWLDKIVPQLKAGQSLWVVGENNGGIKSLTKRLAEHYECLKLDSARHCGLFEVRPKQPSISAENWSIYKFNEIDVYSLPGVFSAGKLDKGTDILLSVLPELKGAILEFGGGSGVLTASLAKQTGVKQVLALEIDLLAVRSSNRTFSENGLTDKAQAVWSDGIKELGDGRFDAIVTNPPFHTGIKTEYGPTEAFFAQAKDRIRRGGKLIWVANDFLNYESGIKADFNSIRTLVHRNGFRVMEATKK